MRLKRASLEHFLVAALMANVFVSKMQIGPHSMGTSMNLALNVALGAPLLLLSIIGSGRPRFSGFYLLIVLLLPVLLCVQNIAREQMPLQIGGILATFGLIAVFGFAIPRTMPIEKFLAILRIVLGIALVGSGILLAAGGNVFDGGRFSGIFRDNILFSQAALLGLTLFGARCVTAPRSYGAWLGLFGYAAGIVLSGSRSALLIAPTAIIVYLFVRRINDHRLSNLRMTAICAAVLMIPFWTPFLVRIATGQVAIGMRARMTNAVADRMQHWGYGIERIRNAPWTGEGVLSKYTGDSGINLAEFDESKDPHNLFVYAGQVGGVPLLFICAIAMGILLIAILRSFRLDHPPYQEIAILLLIYLPMTLAGGSLISLGSLFDRVFWMCAGFLSIRDRRRPETVS